MDWCWSWNSNTLATWYEELTHLKRPWYWERVRAGGEGDDRGWDGWMASPTQWTWVWVNSGSWWWTGRPGMLWFMGSQRIRHDWATGLNTHVPIPFQILLPFRLLHNIEQSSLCYTVGPCWLCILNTAVWTCPGPPLRLGCLPHISETQVSSSYLCYHPGFCLRRCLVPHPMPTLERNSSPPTSTPTHFFSVSQTGVFHCKIFFLAGCSGVRE